MYARNISVSWELPREISFVVELYDGTKRNFYFAQQNEGYANYILIDYDKHYGSDDPLMNMTVTYKTNMVTAISKCLKVLEDEFSQYTDKWRKENVRDTKQTQKPND
tara:strand:- start:595 stop:915 length:321 start_codon:yes stop_codon:yes gene_type:complete